MKATPRRQRVAKRGADGMDTKPPQTSPLHTSANQETRSENPSEKWNRRVKAGGKRSHSKDRLHTWTVWDGLDFGDLATGGKDHIQKHMYTQSEIPESLRARTITHCPSPHPPLREGHHSGPNGSANSDPEPPLAPPPLPQNLPSSLFLSTSFLLCSFSLSVCCLLSLFFLS